MEYGKNEHGEINPRQKTNLFSKITFWYTRTLFKKGFKNELREADLYEVLPEFDTCCLGDSFEIEWNLQKHKKFAMFLVFWNIIGKCYGLLGLSRIISIIINIARPTIIGKLVYYFSPGQKDMSKLDAYLYSIVLIILQFLDIICKQNYFFVVESLAIKVRTGICSLIYRKILNFPASQLRYISFGEVTNLITRDINVFNQFFYCCNEAWIGLISTIIICYQMYQNIGLPVVVVVAAFVIFIPLQVAINIWIGSLKLATSAKTDIRINILQEALATIRSTKMYVWEKYIQQRITKARKDEMDILLKMFIALFYAVAIAIIIVNVTFYLVLLTNVWLDGSITAETMYFVTGCFIGLGINLTSLIPYGTFYLSQVVVALKRMQSVIQNLDIESGERNEVRTTREPKILYKNVKINTNDKVILDNVNVEIKRGLTLVIGHASSGKSVFLMTILKEFQVSQGDLLTEGKISYASQQPWLFASTIKQNIIFGSKHNKKRYQAVIEACALLFDFSLLEDGDSTIVADGGINLSKGQQSRICLARAVYRDCDIYLLDNCLSSLDPLVARFIFVNCILKFLKDKLVILVSDDLNLRSYANNILILDNNTVKQHKNILPVDLEKTNNDNFLAPSGLDPKKLESEKCGLNVCLENECLLENKNRGKIFDENKETKAVSWTTYKTYARLGGGMTFFLIIVSTFVFTQLSLSYKDKLISQWANLEQQYQSESGLLDNSQKELTEKRNQLVINYTLATISLSIMTFLRAYVLVLFSKKISYNLHSKMLTSILHAPLRFFDNNFVAGIINRFSKDLISIDENIPINLLHVTIITVETLGNLFLISSTNLKFIIPTGLLFATLIVSRYIYLKVGRPLKHLDASTKSPVIGYCNATFEGLLSIKVFRAEKILKEEFERRHNIYNSASYSHLCCIKAYVFVVDVCTSAFIAAVILLLLIFNEEVSPGEAGLAISQAFIISITLEFGIVHGADLETQMTSVERTFEYKHMSHEIETGIEPKEWPAHGEIKYENVCLSVNDSKSYLLKNISFVAKRQEKIGIVGRTGAGKTSILSALFRLYETEGNITIDGTDIKTVKLDLLRSSISVIPQDSVLLSGSLRDTIDPGKLHDDEEIWNALGTVHLKHIVPNLGVDVRDLNLTCGQKQLICLVRVLIKKNKILVLDEMVEDVDEETENLISEIIDKKFDFCTVIKIAHKLKFVVGCDKVIVLDNGEVVEYNKPHVLFQNKSSLFYKMSKISGLSLNNFENTKNI